MLEKIIDFISPFAIIYLFIWTHRLENKNLLLELKLNGKKDKDPSEEFARKTREMFKDSHPPDSQST